MEEAIKNRRNRFGSLLLFLKMLSIKGTKEEDKRLV